MGEDKLNASPLQGYPDLWWLSFSISLLFQVCLGVAYVQGSATRPMKMAPGHFLL